MNLPASKVGEAHTIKQKCAANALFYFIYLVFFQEGHLNALNTHSLKNELLLSHKHICFVYQLHMHI